MDALVTATLILRARVPVIAIRVAGAGPTYPIYAELTGSTGVATRATIALILEHVYLTPVREVVVAISPSSLTGAISV